MARDDLSDIIKSAYEAVISDWKSEGISDSVILERLNQDTITSGMKQVIDQAAVDYHDFFKQNRFEIAYKEKISTDTFLSHHNEIWGECFVYSETMYVMALEAGEQYAAYVKDNVSVDEFAQKQYTYMALQYMHGRCCQEFLEVLYLMKLGFADCAYARWRSMYELCCNAAFIIKHGERIAKQFVEQSQTNDHKYSWTSGAKKEDGTELKVTTFQGIQENCDIDESWRKQYKLACFVNHGSPQGTFKRLSLKDEQTMVVVGHSDYGITTPAEHSAISLQWITCMFLRIFPSVDALAQIKAIYAWVEDIRKVYFDTSDKCFGTNINYQEQQRNEV